MYETNRELGVELAQYVEKLKKDIENNSMEDEEKNLNTRIHNQLCEVLDTINKLLLKKEGKYKKHPDGLETGPLRVTWNKI